MTKGVVFPQSGSLYEKLEKTPIGKYMYWKNILLEDDGEKNLENIMNFPYTSEQITNDEIAMDLIMEGVKTESGERVKDTLWSGQMTSDTDDQYVTVYTVPSGYKVIITDFIVNYNARAKLAINNKDIIDTIQPTAESPVQQLYLYHEANEGDIIQVFDNNYGSSLSIIGYKIRL